MNQGITRESCVDQINLTLQKNGQPARTPDDVLPYPVGRAPEWSDLRDPMVIMTDLRHITNVDSLYQAVGEAIAEDCTHFLFPKAPHLDFRKIQYNNTPSIVVLIAQTDLVFDSQGCCVHQLETWAVCHGVVSTEHATVITGDVRHPDQIIAKLQTMPQEGSLYIFAALTDDFIKNIKGLRTIRQAGKKFAPHAKCVAVTLPPISNTNSGGMTGKGAELIARTAQTLAAHLAGCEMACQIASPMHNTSQDQHLLRNIIHILNHEAIRQRVKDPCTGSGHLATPDEKSEKICDTLSQSHLDSISYPGTPPYIRGPYAAMYTSRPWTIRQYAGFSTAQESNAFYKRNLASGQTGLSVAFDLPTHRGYDSDHLRAKGDVGMAGVAIDSVEDMKTLFDGIDLGAVSVSMTMNGAVIPILAFYIVAAEEQGVDATQLAGTIQNDILKEFMVRNTFIYPPAPSLEIIADIFRYTAKHMPKFNSISISGYHLQEAGATPELELAYTLANGLEYIQKGLEAGLNIDDFAPRLSFFFCIGMDFISEVAKLRAARQLWYDFVTTRFHPKNPKSAILRTHCQTSGYSLASKDVYNNVIRTTIEAMAAVLGGTQSLHTNALDEALALPTDESAKIARDTQIYLQTTAGLSDHIDPLGHGAAIEARTQDLVRKAREIINQISREGGMVRAIEEGGPMRAIEEAALKAQSELDEGSYKNIGVNAYPPLTEENIPLLNINTQQVETEQGAALKAIKSTRNNAAVHAALEALKEAALKKTGMMEAAIEAARMRATLGEMSFALEEIYTRHEKMTAVIDGVYLRTKGEVEETIERTRRLIAAYQSQTGSAPKILVAKIGQDGHDRGQKVVASAFQDLGFDVMIGSLFKTPDEVVSQACDGGVDLIGLSSMTGGHKELAPAVITALKARGKTDIGVILGGIVPPEDVSAMLEAGILGVFPPNTNVARASEQVIRLVAEQKGLRLDNQPFNPLHNNHNLSPQQDTAS